MAPRPAAERQPLTRASITKTAKQLFSERGYANTSIEDIANDLGVRKGAVYYHVPRKSDLLTEVATELLRPIAQRADEISRGGSSPLSCLEEIVRSHVTVLVSNREAARVFFEQSRSIPADQRAELERLSTQIEVALDRVLAEGIAAGRFRSAHVPLLRMHVLALCNWPYRWFDEHGSYSLADIAQSVWEQVRLLVAATPISEGPEEEK